MDYTEDDILTKRIQMEAQEYIKEYKQNRETANLRHSIGLTSYLSSSPEIPPIIKSQPLGERELHEEELHVGVSELPGSDERLYIVLDELEASSREREAVAIITMLLFTGTVITLIGLMVGIFLGRIVIGPLNRLTDEIEEFQYQPEKQQPIFHGFERNDEVGALSRAFTVLIERLGEFLQREKEFTRYASHELRTPLTITRNALANLRLKELGPDQANKNLNRIEYAANEMENLIETFLLLGREIQTPVTELLAVDKLLENSLAKHSYLNENNHTEFVQAIEPNVRINNNEKLMQILFDNVIRNTLIHSGAKATVSLDGSGLTIENDFNASNNDSQNDRKSFGLDIVKRISRFCDLHTEIRQTEKTFSVSIYF